MVHGHAKGHRAARIEAGQEDPAGIDIEAAEGHLDRVENPLLGLLQVLLLVRPAVGGFFCRRGDRPAPRDAIGDSPRRDGHVVPHAHQRHDPQQLPLVATRSVQPDHQRVGIARLVVHRREDRVDRVVLVVLNKPDSISNVTGGTSRCERGNDCRGWLMGDSSQKVRLRRRSTQTLSVCGHSVNRIPQQRILRRQCWLAQNHAVEKVWAAATHSAAIC